MNNPVLVPIELRTLIVNEDVLNKKGVNTLRWEFFYPAMKNYGSPQPEPFTGTNLSFPGTGVMLHWTLPDIIRNGEQKGVNVDFPLVPNRWLIVRYSGPLTARTATAWIVQSDSLSDSRDDGGAPFLQPGSATLEFRWVGRQWQLVDWTEQYPSSATDLFLQAVAPGNPTFATFQSYCSNVFSMFDPLAGVAEEDTLSYFVAGWYSNPEFDIAGSWQKNAGNDPDAFKNFLERAGWTLAGGVDDTFSVALYHGMNWGLDWKLKGPAPTNVPDGFKAEVAVGNTTVDALTALLEKQAKEKKSNVDVKLLEALQYGLLPKFDDVDPEFELKQQIEQSWFGYRNGGFGWEIVDVPVDPDLDPPPPISPEELLKEETWLAALNERQQQYDAAVRLLADMQLELYQVWWKSGFAKTNYAAKYPTGTSALQFDEALARTGPNSLVLKVEEQMALIAELGLDIPKGETQEKLQIAIENYAREQELPASRQLKQYALRPFARPNDPVVLFQGMKVDEKLTPDGPLVCRFTNQVITEFFFEQEITAAQLSGVIAVPPPAQMALLPAQLTALIDEFFLLDPDNATMIAAAVFQTSDPVFIDRLKDAMRDGKNIPPGEYAPDLSLGKWTQPWSPLIMLWEVTWYPVPHSVDGVQQWIFNGNDYEWNGPTLDPPPTGIPFKGSIFMTAQASYNFRAQLEKFIAENPDNEAAKELEEFIAQTDNWDFLSQSLVGLSQSMILHNPLPNVSAALGTGSIGGDEFSALVGSNATYVPVPGVPYVKFDPPSTGFQDWRAGQFVFNRLTVVDRFGQAAEKVTVTNQFEFRPTMSKALTPKADAITFAEYRLVQLPPRLPQPARLEFDFVSSTDDNIILGDAPGVNPVCAWLLHNLLDESIACYDNQGKALGEVWVVTNTLDNEVLNWRAAPGSVYTTIDSLRIPFPHLWQMLDALDTIGPPAFRSLINTIDAASWVIDGGNPTADQGLAMLSGQPIAMVRTRLQFELSGNVVTDPSWRFTFNPLANPVTTWPFNIRLGEGAMRQDGLVGYFAGDAYDVFNAAIVPAELPDPQYVRPIGTGAGLSLNFDGSSAAFQTLLMDPRAIVHATTGILPVISVAIPQTFVTNAFAAMDVFFGVGPVLSDLVTSNDPGELDVSTILMPRPMVKKGKWNWEQLELDAGSIATWKEYPVAPTVPTAQFSNVPPVLRSGMLRLHGAFDGTAGAADETNTLHE